MNVCNDLDFGIISIEKLAKALNVVPSTIYNWIREGVIPSYCYKKVRATYFIKKKQIQEWLESEG